MELSEDDLELRRQVLKILMHYYPKDTPQNIYDCADEWCSKHKISAGVKKHYDVYYRRK